MITSRRHMTWDNFRANYISPGFPMLHPVPGSPRVQFFIDVSAARIGLRTPADQAAYNYVSPLAAVEVSVRQLQGADFVEVSSAVPGLYQQFYSLMMDIADHIQLEGTSPTAAVELAIVAWKNLLTATPLLGPERVLGLYGELWLLERLQSRSSGAAFAALDAWVGPLDEPHDFRIGNREFEVKTTTNTQRIHIISSLMQLVPSPEHELYILSLQLEPAGANAGRTLPEMIQAVRRLFGGNPQQLAGFDAAIKNVGYRDEDASHYSRRLQLRTPPCLIRVEAACPRLTPELLITLLGPDLFQRVSDVQYRINVEGLGFPDSTPEFLNLIQ